MVHASQAAIDELTRYRVCMAHIAGCYDEIRPTKKHWEMGRMPPPSKVSCCAGPQRIHGHAVSIRTSELVRQCPGPGRRQYAHAFQKTDATWRSILPPVLGLDEGHQRCRARPTLTLMSLLTLGTLPARQASIQERPYQTRRSSTARCRVTPSTK